jgi:hypothetical protein
MHISFSRTLRRVIPVVAVAVIVTSGASAQAAAVKASLRVEAAGKALDPGTTYATDTENLKTDTRADCGGTGATKTVPGPTAIGILGTASAKNPLLRPLGISDKFSFGLTVCGIGKYFGFGSTSFWLFKVDHKAATIGADQYQLKAGDSVLWYFEDTAKKVNTGDELALQVPAHAVAGKPFKVTVWAYDANGKRKVVQGAKVAGAGSVKTDSGGHATIKVTKARTVKLRATHGPDIASATLAVKVGSK